MNSDTNLHTADRSSNPSSNPTPPMSYAFNFLFMKTYRHSMCTDPLTACPHLSPPPHRMPHRMPAFPGPGDRKSTEKGEGDVAKERGMCTYTAAKRERRGPRMHVHRSPNHFSFLRNTPYISSRQTSCTVYISVRMIQRRATDAATHSSTASVCASAVAQAARAHALVARRRL